MTYNLNELKAKAASLGNLQDHRAAIEIYNEILNIKNNEFETWKNLSTSLLRTGDFDAAIVAANNSIEIAQTSVDNAADIIIQLAIVNLVAAYGQKGEYKKAITETEKALSKYPDNERLWNNLASFQFDSSMFKQALQSVNKALTIRSEYELAYCLKGQILLNLGREKEALLILNEVLDQNPYNINANWAMWGYHTRNDDSAKAQVYEERLKTLLGKRECEEFKRRLEKAMGKAKYRSDSNLSVNAALAMGAGKFTIALELYENYLKDNKEDVNSLVAYGHCLYETGNRNEAKNVFEKAIQLDSGCAEAYQNLARYYIDTEGESKEEAIRLSTKAIDLHAKLDMAWTNRAVVHFQLGNLSLANRDIKHALELNPQNAIAWANYGIFKYQEDNCAAALNAFQEAIKLDPALLGVLKTFIEDCR